MDNSQRAAAIERLEAGDLPVSFGRFRLTRLLGTGGMARVFRADMDEAGARQTVALKVLRATWSSEGLERASALKTEARVGAALHHENIVTTYDVGEVEGQPFIALEYVDGVTLQQLLEESGPPSLGATLELGRQIALGLEAAHSAAVDGEPLGLVHRDLKPANVMVDRQGVVKLMDFGVAKARKREWNGTTTQMGRVKGTPMYMSPEQARGLDVDARSDLFPLGAILYELITGRRLFVGTSIPSVLMRVMCVEGLLKEDSEFRQLRLLRPGLAAVIARCLRVRSDERFRSAGDVAEQLAQLQDDEDVDVAGLVRSVLDQVEAPAAHVRRPIRLVRTWHEPTPTSPQAPTCDTPGVATAAAMATTLVGKRSEAVLEACDAPFTDPHMSFFDLPVLEASTPP